MKINGPSFFPGTLWNLLKSFFPGGSPSLHPKYACTRSLTHVLYFPLMTTPRSSNKATSISRGQELISYLHIFPLLKRSHFVPILSSKYLNNACNLLEDCKFGLLVVKLPAERSMDIIMCLVADENIKGEGDLIVIVL